MTLTLREKIGARLERASFYSQVILGFAVGNVLYFAIKAKDLVKKADSIDLTSGLFHRLLSEEELKKQGPQSLTNPLRILIDILTENILKITEGLF